MTITNLPISTFACKDKTLRDSYFFLYNQALGIKNLCSCMTSEQLQYHNHMNEELIDETESKCTYTKIKPTTSNIGNGEQHSNQSGLSSTGSLCKNITYCSSVNKCIWKNKAMNTLVKRAIYTNQK